MGFLFKWVKLATKPGLILPVKLDWLAPLVADPYRCNSIVRQKPTKTKINREKRTENYIDGQKGTEMDRNRQKQIKSDKKGQKRTEANINRQKRTKWTNPTKKVKFSQV